MGLGGSISTRPSPRNVAPNTIPFAGWVNWIAVRERDADAIVHEREILHAGRLGGVKGRLPQRFPDLVGGAATWPNTRGASAAIPSRRRRTRTRFTFMEQTPRGTENSL